MALSGVEFFEEGMCAQAFQHAAGFVDGGADFGFVGETRFEGEGTEEGVECVVRKMPAAEGFVDEASDEPGGCARSFCFGDDSPDALRRVRLASTGFVIGEGMAWGKGFEEVRFAGRFGLGC